MGDGWNGSHPQEPLGGRRVGPGPDAEWVWVGVCVCVCVTVSAHSVGLCGREGLADLLTCLVSQAGPLGTKPQA